MRTRKMLWRVKVHHHYKSSGAPNMQSFDVLAVDDEQARRMAVAEKLKQTDDDPDFVLRYCETALLSEYIVAG